MISNVHSDHYKMFWQYFSDFDIFQRSTLQLFAYTTGITVKINIEKKREGVTSILST